MKSLTSFVCEQCGYESPQWMGKCPECGEWNSLKEFQISNSKSQTSNKFTNPKSQVQAAPKKIDEIKTDSKTRIKTGFSEADGVLGGGIVSGSVVLLAGDPGIGKSTLLLQIALNLAKKEKVLYLSGEESEQQVSLRAKRISNGEKNNLLLLSLSDTDQAVELIAKEKPALAIIDSIQTMESQNLSGLSGSVAQVRYATANFIKAAKNNNVPVIIVGHVTKEGMVAGPMLLSHMVDTVLFLEGEKNTGTRILRSLKNRFGPVDEVGVFAMNEQGLEEVKNPEQIFLSKDGQNAPGSVLAVTMEGTRAFLVEVQALVLYSKLPMPRRVVSGFDAKRLELLLAVLQKHCRLPLDTMDVYVNVVGGLKLQDPAADLAVCLAIFSSFKNVPLKKTIGIAEVGLLGEVRKVSFLDKRINQAKKLGFENVLDGGKYRALDAVLKALQ